MLVDLAMIISICVVVPIAMIGAILAVEFLIDKVLNKYK